MNSSTTNTPTCTYLDYRCKTKQKNIFINKIVDKIPSPAIHEIYKSKTPCTVFAGDPRHIQCVDLTYWILLNTNDHGHFVCCPSRSAEALEPKCFCTPISPDKGWTSRHFSNCFNKISSDHLWIVVSFVHIQPQNSPWKAIYTSAYSKPKGFNLIITINMPDKMRTRREVSAPV